MEVQDLILADYAAANPNGKFTLVGAGFTTITTKQMPCLHPLMFILLRLKITEEDRGKNKIEISIRGEKGVIFNSEGTIDIPSHQAPEQFIALPVQVLNLKIESQGEYSIEAKINGAESQKSQKLFVKQIDN